MSDSTARSRAAMPKGTNTVLNRRTLSGDHRVLARLLEPGMRVLDVGCGTGAITEGIALAVAPGQVVGTDINDALLAEANRRAASHSNLRFQCADVYDLPWNEEFDLVTSSRVLQWLDNSRVALAQMMHCIRPEGYLVVLDYNHEKAEWRPPIPDSMASFYRAFLEWRAQSGMNNAIADDLERLLVEAGFRNVVVEVSDEVSNRTDSDFRDKVEIWKKVAETRGHQVVGDGYFEEEERASASRDFETWLLDRAEYQRLYLRTAIGRK
jgi:ubiquinone/menaquinone biosynthesis C-methylase UbiE